jgi:hypothetical protein
MHRSVHRRILCIYLPCTTPAMYCLFILQQWNSPYDSRSHEFWLGQPLLSVLSGIAWCSSPVPCSLNVTWHKHCNRAFPPDAFAGCFSIRYSCLLRVGIQSSEYASTAAISIDCRPCYVCLVKYPLFAPDAFTATQSMLLDIRPSFSAPQDLRSIIDTLLSRCRLMVHVEFLRRSLTRAYPYTLP